MTCRLWITSLLAALSAAGCSHPAASGFLSPYYGFQRSSVLSTDLEYVAPHVNWKAYRKVRILPVVLYYAPGAHPVSRNDAAELTGFFERQLAKSFSEEYQVVYASGPGVLDVRAAITNLRPTDVAQNTAVQGAGLLLPLAWGVGIQGYKGLTGDQLGMGEAQVEAEFLDSRTQRRVYGYVARKIGSSLDLPGQSTPWGVVETALTRWSRFLSAELAYRQDPTELKRLRTVLK